MLHASQLQTNKKLSPLYIVAIFTAAEFKFKFHFKDVKKFNLKNSIKTKLQHRLLWDERINWVWGEVEGTKKNWNLFHFIFYWAFVMKYSSNFEVWYKGMEKESKSWINAKSSLSLSIDFHFMLIRYRCYKNLITFDLYLLSFGSAIVTCFDGVAGSGISAMEICKLNKNEIVSRYDLFIEFWEIFLMKIWLFIISR